MFCSVSGDSLKTLQGHSHLWLIWPLPSFPATSLEFPIYPVLTLDGWGAECEKEVLEKDGCRDSGQSQTWGRSKGKRSGDGHSWEARGSQLLTVKEMNLSKCGGWACRIVHIWLLRIPSEAPPQWGLSRDSVPVDSCEATRSDVHRNMPVIFILRIQTWWWLSNPVSRLWPLTQHTQHSLAPLSHHKEKPTVKS